MLVVSSLFVDQSNAVSAFRDMLPSNQRFVCMPGGQSGDSLSKTMATKLSRKGARLEQCYEQLEQIRHVVD